MIPILAEQPQLPPEAVPLFPENRPVPTQEAGEGSVEKVKVVGAPCNPVSRATSARALGGTETLLVSRVIISDHAANPAITLTGRVSLMPSAGDEGLPRDFRQAEAAVLDG